MNVDQLPSGRWRVRVSHDGRRASGTAKTRTDAQVLGGKLLAEFGKVNDDEQTFGVFLLWHVTTHDLEVTTRDDYQRVVRRFIDSEHRLVEFPVGRVTTPLLVQCYDDLVAGDWSAHRVCRLHEVVGGAFRRAKRYGIVDTNPAIGAGPKRPRKPDIKVPSTDDVARLLDACDGEFVPALTVTAMTGLRRGELVGLKWSDLDLDTESITIRRAVTSTTATGVVVRDTVKNDAAGERVIALDPHTASVLKAYRKDRIEFYLALGHPFADDDWVFKNHKTGGPRRPDWVTQRFIRMRKDLGLEHVRLYDLRHFMVTSMLAAGMAPTTVAGRAGHDVGTMLKRYVHFMPASDRAEATAFAATIQAARRKQAR
jgi:integrase